jgi:hypothetical protein
MIKVFAGVLAVSSLTVAACTKPRQTATPKFPAAIPLVRAERQLAGCWQVLRGLGSISLIQLDTAVRAVFWLGRYFNDHPLLPEPDGYDTGWHIEAGDTARLEWKTPKRPKGAVGPHMYGGRFVLAVAEGDTLRGGLEVYTDVNPPSPTPVLAVRTTTCPPSRP